MARSTSKVAIKVDVDSKDLDKLKADLKKSAANLQVMSKAAKENAKNMQKMQAQITKLNAQVAKGNKAVLGWLEGWKGLTARFLFLKHAATQVAHFVGAIGRAAKEGAAFSDMMNVMRGRVANFDGVMSDARVSTAGMMSDFAMAKSSALMSSFGIDMSRMAEVMGVVSKAAISTGQDANFMMESFARGVARMSPLILDNLGIQISLSDAFQNHADTLGKVTSEMSKAEKIAAVMDETLRKLRVNTATLDLDETMSAPLQRAEVILENATLALKGWSAEVLVSLLAGHRLAEVQNEVNKAFAAGEEIMEKGLSGRRERTPITPIAEDFFPDWFTDVVEGSSEAAEAWELLQGNAQSLANEVSKLVDVEDQAAKRIAKLSKEMRESTRVAAAYERAFKAGVAASAGDAKVALGALLSEVEDGIPSLQEGNKALFALSDAGENLKNSMDGAAASARSVAEAVMESERSHAKERAGVDELNKSLQGNIEFLQMSDSAKSNFKKATDAVKVAQDAYKAALDRSNTSERARIGLANELTAAYKAQGVALADLMLKQFEAGEQPGVLEEMGISAWWAGKGKKKPPKKGGKAPTKDFKGWAQSLDKWEAAAGEGMFAGSAEGLALLKAENKALIRQRGIEWDILEIKEKISKRGGEKTIYEEISLGKLSNELALSKELLKVELEKIKAEVDAAELEKAAAEDSAMRLTPSQFLTEAVGDRKSVFGDLVRDSADMYGMAFEAVEAQIDAIAETRTNLFDEFGVSLDALNPKLSEYEQSLIRQRDLMLDIKEVFSFMGNAVGDMGDQLDIFSAQLQSFSDMEPTIEFIKVQEAVAILAQTMDAMGQSASAAGLVEGAISGIGKITAAFVDGEREKAWVLFAMNQAQAIVDFATMNIPGGIARQTAAAMFLSIATGAIKTHRPAPASMSAAGAPKSSQAKSVENVVNVHISGLTTISEAELGFQIHNALSTAKEHGYV